MSASALPVHQPEAADGAVALRPGLLPDPRADRDARARTRLGRSERELTARLGLGRTPVREALRAARPGAARRGVPAARDVRLGRRRARPRGPSEVRRHAREPRRTARRRAGDTGANARRSTTLLGELDARPRERRARPDRPRPAHPPPRLPLRAQPVPRGDAGRVLRAHPAHLVPRARPRRAPRGRRPASIASCCEAIRDGDADRAEEAMRRHVASFEQAISARALSVCTRAPERMQHDYR